ncbi:MAG: hypothetical protein AAF968_26405, partial [Pseudomonadota bacterium]
GIFRQFENPTFADLMIAIAVGFALTMILAVYWRGAWLLPEMVGAKALRVYFAVALIAFLACFGISTTANLSATGAVAAEQIVQADSIDAFDNAGAKATLYVERVVVPRDAIEARAELASQAETDEIAGRGPTGIGGAGSVSNSFGEASRIYGRAAASLHNLLGRARERSDELAATVAEMRVVQADDALSAEARATRLKLLSSQAIGDIRGLLALDPGRSIRAAADAIAAGVPPRSQARASSQARIAEISADMRAFAETLRAEANAIAALAPTVPEQVTPSQTEQLLAAALRMPALLMVAILIDACGFIAIGWRVALHSALQTRMEEEADEPGPTYATTDDIWRFTGFLGAMEAARREVEASDGTPRRGRPRKAPGATKRATKGNSSARPSAAKPAAKDASKSRKPRREGETDA